MPQDMLPRSIVELVVPMQGFGGSDSYNSGLDTVTKVYFDVIVGVGDAQGYSENGRALNSLDIVKIPCKLRDCLELCYSACAKS